jgi:RHS repeat-associated protein
MRELPVALLLSLASLHSAFAGRYYDARISRWLEVDPALNRWNTGEIMKHDLFEVSVYQYVHDNPASRIDVDGYVDKDGNRVFVGVETSGLGHAYTWVQDKNGNKTAYTYGRYDGGSSSGTSLGGGNPVGSGVLIKYSGDKAVSFIGKELGKDGGAAYEIVDADGSKVMGHFDSQYEAGKPSERNSEGRIVDTYVIGANTCVNSVVSGLEAGGVGGAASTEIINPKTGKKSVTPPLTPSELKSVLEAKSKSDNSGIKKAD